MHIYSKKLIITYLLIRYLKNIFPSSRSKIFFQGQGNWEIPGWQIIFLGIPRIVKNFLNWTNEIESCGELDMIDLKSTLKQI